MSNYISVKNSDGITIINDSYQNLSMIRHFTLADAIEQLGATIQFNDGIGAWTYKNDEAYKSVPSSRYQYCCNWVLNYEMPKALNETIVAVRYDGELTNKTGFRVGVSDNDKIFVDINGTTIDSFNNGIKIDNSKLHIYTFGYASSTEKNGIRVYNEQSIEVFNSSNYYLKILKFFNINIALKGYKISTMVNPVQMPDSDISMQLLDMSTDKKIAVCCGQYPNPFSGGYGLHLCPYVIKYKFDNAPTLDACFVAIMTAVAAKWWTPVAKHVGCSYHGCGMLVDVSDFPIIF